MSAPLSAISLENRVELARVRIFFGHASGNMASIMVGAVLVSIVLHGGGVALPVLAIWGVLLGAAAAGIALFERRVEGIGLTVENCRRLALVRIALGAGMALFYGLAGLLLPGPAPVPDTFLFIIVSTIVSIATLSYSVMPAYYFALNVVSLMALTVHLGFQYAVSRDSYYLLLITVSILWQFLVLSKARRVSLTTIDAIILNERLRDEVEENRLTRDAMRHMALHDDLTCLANRRYFDETIKRTLSIAARDPFRFGLLAVDLNDFKPVNDRHGHAGGDLLLKAVAERMLGAIRAGDFCARMGGDEFAIILASLHAEADVVDVANKLRSVLAEPFMLGDSVVPMSASIGWAVYPDDATDADALMALADQRMYREKQRFSEQVNLRLA